MKWWDTEGVEGRKCWRVALTDEGKAKCAELIAKYGGRPIRLLKSKLYGLFRRALAAGFDEDTLELACLEAAAHAVRRFDPTVIGAGGRSPSLETTLMPSIKQTVNELIRDRIRNAPQEQPDYHREYKPHLIPSREQPPAFASAPGDSLLEFNDLIDRAHCDKRTRFVLTRTFIDGITRRDLAAEMGVSHARVGQVLERGLAKIKERLKPADLATDRCKVLGVLWAGEELLTSSRIRRLSGLSRIQCYVAISGLVERGDIVRFRMKYSDKYHYYAKARREAKAA